MKKQTFDLRERASDQTPVVHAWTPEAAPQGVIVLAHGMGEHALRYARFAGAACEAGYAVYAPDHRGHGQTARDASKLGDFGREGWRGLVDDLAALVERVRGLHTGCPIVLLGHSMGSMAVQHYLTESSDRIDAAALSGTAAVDRMGAASSDPDADLFDSFNRAFEPTRTAFDWLSREDAEVDRYVDDPLCGFAVEGPSLDGMISAGARYSEPGSIARIRKDLPIYLFAGDRDPVGGEKGELVRLVAERYRAAGIADVIVRLYPEARHELLNEINRDAVTSDFLAWAMRWRG